jgi:hypothetical protein
VQSEFDRQTKKTDNQLRVEEIHHEDQRKINKIVEDNPELTLDDDANIYYDSKEMAKPTIQYQRGNFLVADDEFKILTTYMRDLHQYYMAEEQRRAKWVSKLLSAILLFLIILLKRSTLSIGSACFSYTRGTISIHKY